VHIAYYINIIKFITYLILNDNINDSVTVMTYEFMFLRVFTVFTIILYKQVKC